jgi:hypothetical protein
MGIKPARLEAIEALYASRKGQDNFVDYEIKVYKGIYLMVLPLHPTLTGRFSRMWCDYFSSGRKYMK